jgi:hypothetical protein
VRRINHGHDAVDAEALGDEEVVHQRVDHRRRVGQPGRFDDDAADRLQLAPHAAHEQIGQAARQVAAHGAADAAGVEHDHVFVDLGDQMVVDGDLPNSLISTAALAISGWLQQMIEQRGLAGAEKAGEDGDRDFSARQTGVCMALMRLQTSSPSDGRADGQCRSARRFPRTRVPSSIRAGCLSNFRSRSRTRSRLFLGMARRPGPVPLRFPAGDGWSLTPLLVCS